MMIIEKKNVYLKIIVFLKRNKLFAIKFLLKISNFWKTKFRRKSCTNFHKNFDFIPKMNSLRKIEYKCNK